MILNDDDIFGEALDLPPAARAAFLDRACAGDTTRRARLEALLSAHDSAGDFLETPPVVRAILGADEAPGDTIDRYTLLEKIGEGGWGTVYLAEQTFPVRRRVALKILKLGLDTRQVIARFEGERQALALMDHPDIARVFDMGATDSGRPFFVMEFVDGAPITKFCDQHRLPLAKRVELFARVCLAVQHAHRKGIIHRDLKPSNILVALHDGVPTPKIIDFGIAKATGERLTEATLVTGLGQLIGTPVYMSPEQADLREHDIDTRSDLYALGVVLYELLTGRTPLDPQQLSQAGIDGMLRLICSAQPARPSDRFAQLPPADRTTLAQLRHTTPPQLVSSLRGDLDSIVLHCLEKDRDRRYGSAQELADDLRRHLAYEPILARPPGTAYRLGKFVARHRVACASAAAIAATLVAGTIVSTRQAIRATHAEHTARAERDHAQRRQQQAEELLTFMLGDFRTELQNIGRLELLDSVGEKAMAYFAALDPRDLTDTELIRQAQALTQIGEIRLDQARYDEAFAAFSAAYARADALAARYPENGDMLFERAQAEYWIGFVARRRGDRDAERAWLTRYRDSALALAALEPDTLRARLELTYGHHNLAVLDFDRGDLAAAHAGFLAEKNTLEQLIVAHPDDTELQFSLCDTASWLGTVAEADGRFADALQHFIEMTAVAHALVAREPSVHRWQLQLARSLSHSATIESLLGRHDAARALHARAEALIQPLVTRDPQNREWQLLLLRPRLAQASLLLHHAPDSAAEILDDARRQFTALIEAEPSSQPFNQFLALAWRLEAHLRFTHARPGAADAIARALELNDRFLADPHPDPSLHLEAANTHLLAGRIALANDDRDTAHRHCARVLELLGPAALAHSRNWRLLDPALQALTLLGRSADALSLAEKLKQFGYRPIDPFPASLLEAVPDPSSPNPPAPTP